MGNELGNIFNFLQLTPSIATAGQPTEQQLSIIREAGYKIIINLATSSFESRGANNLS